MNTLTSECILWDSGKVVPFETISMDCQRRQCRTGNQTNKSNETHESKKFYSVDPWCGSGRAVHGWLGSRGRGRRIFLWLRFRPGPPIPPSVLSSTGCLLAGIRFLRGRVLPGMLIRILRSGVPETTADPVLCSTGPWARVHDSRPELPRRQPTALPGPIQILRTA